MSEPTTQKSDLPIEAETPALLKPVTTKSESTSSAASFAILVSILALLASAFTWYQTQVLNVRKETTLAIGVAEIGGQISRLGDAISQLKAEQSNVVLQTELNNQLTQLQLGVDASVASLGDRQSEIQSSLNSINDDMQKGVKTYVFDEVAQLLKLANHNVAFKNDANTAINALLLADQQLKQLGDPRFATVRSAINGEVSSLRAVQQIDLEAVSGSLNTLSALVPELPLANEPEITATQTDVSEAESAEEITWRSELAKLWQDIKGSVQIQRVDQPPKPLLVPGQRYFLDQNLQLQMAKAELALMQGRSDVYQQSLRSAITWLNDYFDTNDTQVVSVLEQLNELTAQNLIQTLPNISGSYDALLSAQGE